MPKATNHQRVQVESDLGVHLELTGFLEADPGYTGLRHAHSFWELVYLAEGSGVLHYGEQQHLVRGGDAYLLEPAIEHQLRLGKEKPLRQLFAGFTVVGGFPDWNRNLDLPMLSKQETLPLLPMLDDIVARIKRETAQADLDACTADVVSVLLKFLSNQVHGAGPILSTASRSAMLVEKVKRLLAANPHQSFTVNDLAASFYLTPHYFGELFKRHTGLSIKHYHHQLRLHKAADMLRDPQLQVSQIASELGYNSLHYFSRRFKQHYGVSPTAFRATLNRPEEPSP